MILDLRDSHLPVKVGGFLRRVFFIILIIILFISNLWLVKVGGFLSI